MKRSILTSKIILVITLIILAFGQLNTSLAAPAGKSDELINQLSVIAKQTDVQQPFLEIIDLTENCAKVMQQEYFEIDEDYTDVILGDKLKKLPDTYLK